MRHGREKRLLVGLVAVLAPLPLPLTGVTLWPVLGLYWMACALFLLRAHRGAERWLPAWAMNLLALAYLPILFADLGLFWRGRLLQPLVHLALFTLVVKLFALKREADKWHALLGAFFLYLAAMGSSVHPSVVIYQIAMLALWYLVLTRLAGWNEIGRDPTAGRVRVPLAGFVSVVTLATLVVAIPLFVLLPRFRQPYVVAPGLRSGSGQATGFTDQVTLDTIGRVRGSSAVALRFQLDRTLQISEFRFKESTYDLFRDNAWRRGDRASVFLQRSQEGWFRIAEGRPRAWMEIWRRIGSTRLPLPVEAVVLEAPTRTISLDNSGVTGLLVEPGGIFGFRAGLSYEPTAAWEVPSVSEFRDTELETSRVTPRMAELAAEVMGEGAPLERALRLERHLISQYSYTLDLGSQSTDRPIERFLFDTRAGHCEYFATAMVLLLRSQGIPARFVTGYYGAEYNPLQQYFIVRMSNAHAWVEALLPERGWTTFDPTPPAGLPAESSSGWLTWWSQAYDFLVFRWDRYVLTYGFGDQADFFLRFRDLLASLWSGWGKDDSEGFDAVPKVEEDSVALTDEREPLLERELEALRWIPMGLVVLVLCGWLWRARRAPSALRAYTRLRHELERHRVALTRATPPREVERRLARLWPEAQPAAARVVALYLRESFGGVAPDAAEREEIARAMRSVRKALSGRGSTA